MATCSCKFSFTFTHHKLELTVVIISSSVQLKGKYKWKLAEHLLYETRITEVCHKVWAHSEKHQRSSCFYISWNRHYEIVLVVSGVLTNTQSTHFLLFSSVHAHYCHRVLLMTEVRRGAAFSMKYYWVHATSIILNKYSLGRVFVSVRTSENF